jgi:hypothetical protein
MENGDRDYLLLCNHEVVHVLFPTSYASWALPFFPYKFLSESWLLLMEAHIGK